VAKERKRPRPRQQPVDPTVEAGLQPTTSIPEAVRRVGDVDEFDIELAHGAELAGEVSDNGELAVDEGELTRESEEAAAAAFGEPEERERRPAKRPAAEAAAPRRSLFSRAIAFLQASWAELQRVQWPDRRQVAQATAVVLGFVAVAGIYLGAADWLAQKVVNFIL
jgi:preprotein translocase subunit SecE